MKLGLSGSAPIPLTSVGTDAPKPSPFSPVALSLDAAMTAEGLRRVAFTAVYPREGVSTAVWHVAQELAAVYARQPVIVELDAGKSSLSARLGMLDGPTLTDVLQGTIAPALALKSVGNGVRLLSGRVGGAPRLVMPHAGSIVDALDQEGDIVLFDLPPVLRSADALLLARLAGAAVLVVAAGEVPYPALQRLRMELDTAGVAVIGAVLNRHRKLIPGWLYRILR